MVSIFWSQLENECCLLDTVPATHAGLFLEASQFHFHIFIQIQTSNCKAGNQSISLGRQTRLTSSAITISPPTSFRLSKENICIRSSPFRKRFHSDKKRFCFYFFTSLNLPVPVWMSHIFFFGIHFKYNMYCTFPLIKCRCSESCS